MNWNDVLNIIEESPDYQRRKQEETRFLEMLEADKRALHEDPRRFTDRELMERIEGLANIRSTIPFDDEYSVFVERLSFSSLAGEERDAQALKSLWGEFLQDTIGNWIWPHDLSIAEWYVNHDRPTQAVAIFEHLYARMRRDELAPQDRDREIGSVLTRLFELCTDQGLTGRARQVAGLIDDYQADGLIDIRTYAEILSRENELRWREFGQLVEEERARALDRLRGAQGWLFGALHAATKKLVVDAELWSHPPLRTLEPIAALRHWSLAIETEFHYKVVHPNRDELQAALNELTPPVKPYQSCSPGQIKGLIGFGKSKPRVGAVLSRLRGGADLARNSDLAVFLQVVSEHSRSLRHVDERGLYTAGRCSEFVDKVRSTGHVFQFFNAIQPR